MKYADTVGLDKAYAAIVKYRERYGDLWWTPSPLLEQLANAGRTFQEWSESR